MDFWDGGVAYEESRCGRLKLLPKKGDLSGPNNWRGIMLLVAPRKVVSSVISNRLQEFLKTEGMEEQCGSMPGRGCSDASFSLQMALSKRKEHGLPTWALFVDLVKAFDLHCQAPI